MMMMMMMMMIIMMHDAAAAAAAAAAADDDDDDDDDDDVLLAGSGVWAATSTRTQTIPKIYLLINCLPENYAHKTEGKTQQQMEGDHHGGSI